MVCLFHEHDWETALLKQAIDGPCFYVGAMGSVRTHENRCKILREIGASQKQIDMIKGPIGLIPAQRNARFLAVSILAEIIQVAQAKNLI
jgi:xanthine dehydrogenase accessory factor